MSEIKRGCGWRKIGALYLCGTGLGFPCPLLPYNLHDCKTCGGGIKFSRGFQWLDKTYFQVVPQEECPDVVNCGDCPFVSFNPLGLMWVGETYYTPVSFITEARAFGVSKRIPWVPKELKLGETWILLAHPHAGDQRTETEVAGAKTIKFEKCPAVFYAFRPRRVEKLLTQETATPEELETLEKRNIVPVIVEDDERHRETKKKKKPLPTTKTEIERKLSFGKKIRDFFR